MFYALGSGAYFFIDKKSATLQSWGGARKMEPGPSTGFLGLLVHIQSPLDPILHTTPRIRCPTLLEHVPVPPEHTRECAAFPQERDSDLEVETGSVADTAPPPSSIAILL